MEFWFFRLCVHYGLRIFRSLAYVFRFCHKYLSYGFRIWFPKWFSDFPIWIPVSLRSKRLLISNSRETSEWSSCQHCIGPIRVLRTGMWTLIDFDGFAWGFRFWSNFFAVLRLWIIFSTAWRFLMDPLILLYSGVPHGFLFCKLKISLSKITNLHFRSVPCLKLQ